MSSFRMCRLLSSQYWLWMTTPSQIFTLVVEVSHPITNQLRSSTARYSPTSMILIMMMWKRPKIAGEVVSKYCHCCSRFRNGAERRMTRKGRIEYVASVAADVAQRGRFHETDSECLDISPSAIGLQLKFVKRLWRQWEITP